MKIFFSLAFTFVSLLSNAQTNVFPDNGNVGIGTLTPPSILTIRSAGTGMSFNPGGFPYLGTFAFNRETATGAIYDSRGSAFQINNGGTDQHLHFQVYKGNGDAVTGDALVISGLNAYVGIGTANPSERLSVNGKIRAQEIKVEAANWPDYVFRPDYKLKSLAATEKFIAEKGHLPNMPTAEEAEKNGISLGEMNRKMLEKIEELTLHLIGQQKRIDQQEKTIAALQQQISTLKK